MVQGQKVSKPKKEVSTKKEEQVWRKKEQKQEPRKEGRGKVGFGSLLLSNIAPMSFSGPGQGLQLAEDATQAPHRTPTPLDRAAATFFEFYGHYIVSSCKCSIW